jgi:hypothetical protein
MDAPGNLVQGQVLIQQFQRTSASIGKQVG